MGHVFMPFSPHYDFVAYRGLTIAGVAYKAGETIDKSRLDPRRLMQLYAQRAIVPASGFGGAPAPPYLNNGAGIADKLAAELAAEEAAAPKTEAKRREPTAMPTAPKRANAKKAAAASPAAKNVARKSAPAAKRGGGRAA